MLFTALNLRGVQTSARINKTLLRDHGRGDRGVFLVHGPLHLSSAAVSGGIFLHPFYNPQTFTISRVFHGTSVAVLTYIGFDGISTLSEEVDNPKRNIFLATVLVCVVTGFLAAAEVYGAQLLSYAHFGKDFGVFSEFGDENVFSHVAGIAGGVLMTKAISITLLIATVGSGMGSQLGAARLLYGMGRSGAISKKFFGAIHPKTRIPANNVIFVGGIALLGAFLISYDDGANMLNFGALIAFMGVNLAALTHYYIRGNDRTLGQLIPPVLGFIICFLLWISLNRKAIESWRNLDDGGYRLWSLEDARIPERPGEFRCAAGRVMEFLN